MDYYITNDPIEILSGTSNKTSPVYVEAAKVVSGDNTQKSLGYLKGFADSIEKAMSHTTRDSNIVASGGNIESYSGYKTITDALGYLNKHLPSNEDVKALQTIVSCLQKYNTSYSEGYKNKIQLIMFEYEAAVIMLVKGVSYVITTSTDINIDDNGKIVISKMTVRGQMKRGLISRTIRDMASELSKKDHSKYLSELIVMDGENYKETETAETKEPETEVKTESTVEAAKGIADIVIAAFRYGRKGIGGVIRMVQLVIRTGFGILPLIRSAIYLFWKKKADTISNLETQAKFIELNVEQLQNKKDVDPDKKEIIIKKQQAIVEAYRKKAMKLRAELFEEERLSSEALNSPEAKINDSDDFVLD